MERKGNPVVLLILLIVVPVVVVGAVWIFITQSKPRTPVVPEANFLSEAVFVLRFATTFGSTETETPTAPFPLLQVGDRADPRFIRHDFHILPDGYRAVDHTGRRVITMNEGFEVVAVLDRMSPIPDGLWQDIDAVRIDSSGNIYLLDRGRNLVQVLDSSGHYLRRHIDLGLDLFGETMDLLDIQLDRLDRLWVIGANRIYVLDRHGNLLRIFERRGAPYNIGSQVPSQGIPTEETHLGYTILPSTAPFSSASNVERPVVLESGTFNRVILGRTPGSQLIYILQQQGLGSVMIFDWEGRKRGEIDLTAIVLNNERQFVVGPDGYLYLIDPAAGEIIVMDPLGDPVTIIEIEGLPDGDWVPGIQATGMGRLDIAPSVRAFVDWDGWLIVYDTAGSEIYRFAMREEHLEEMSEVLGE